MQVSAPSVAASRGTGIGDSCVSDICTVHDGDKGFLQGLYKHMSFTDDFKNVRTYL